MTPDLGADGTPSGADRPFLSIGEVLQLLHDEFPDVTISKIRFLESQGLLDPERTPSGYRKFYEGDVERLRWILQQQKENFLPLKVIKGRLEAELDTGPARPAQPDAAPSPAPPTTSSPSATATTNTPAATSGAGSAPSAPAPAAPAPPAASPATPASPAAPAPPTASPVAVPAPRVASGDRRGPLTPELTGTSLTRDELSAASGLDDADLDDLERYGLVTGRPVAGQTYYDGEALVVSRLAAAYARFGVEPRHLRMYKTAAEREAGFFEQLVMPLIKQRNPAARRQAIETLDELAGLGERLRAAMLRQALHDHTHQR